MADRETLPPGELPHITDTNALPLHPATVVMEAYVGVDESKCSKAELVEVLTRHPRPNLYTPPQHETPDHERDHRGTGHIRPDRA